MLEIWYKELNTPFGDFRKLSSEKGIWITPTTVQSRLIYNVDDYELKTSMRKAEKNEGRVVSALSDLSLADIACHFQMLFDRRHGLGSPGLHIGIFPVLGFLLERGKVL